MNNTPVLRDGRQRLLGGVCAGLARHWGVDPLLVRAGLVVATVVTSGLGILLYLTLWLALPLDAASRRRHRTPARILAILGLLLLISTVLMPQSRGASIGFALLAGLGIIWIAATRRSRHAAQAPTAPPVEQQWRQPPSAALYMAPPVASPQPGASAWVPAAPRAGRRGTRPLTWWGVLLGIGVAWTAFAVLSPGGGTGGVAYPAAAAVVVGLALLAASRPSRSRYRRPRGLVAAGLVASLATVSMMLPARGEVSSVRTIVSASGLSDPIEVGVGTHVVDLSRLSAGDDLSATIHVDAGRVTVILPPDLAVRAHYVVGLGQLRTPQHRLAAMDTDIVEIYPGDAGQPQLTLTVQADVGDVEVRR